MMQVHGVKELTPYPGRSAGYAGNGKHCYTLKAVLNLQKSAVAIVARKSL